MVNVVARVLAGTRLYIDGLTDPPRYNAFAAYNRAKLALTLERAARYAEEGIVPVPVHPGIVFGTRFGNDMPAWLNREEPGLAFQEHGPCGEGVVILPLR